MPPGLGAEKRLPLELNSRAPQLMDVLYPHGTYRMDALYPHGTYLAITSGLILFTSSAQKKKSSKSMEAFSLGTLPSRRRSAG